MGHQIARLPDPQAAEALTLARQLLVEDPIVDASVMLKLAQLGEKLGNFGDALKWTDQARDRLSGIPGSEAARQAARAAGRADRPSR
jgi:hypothetical protein